MKLHYIFASLLAAGSLFLSSCNKNLNESTGTSTPDGPVEMGIAEFKISLGGSASPKLAPVSKATDTGTATEKQVKKVDLLVFNLGNDATPKADGVLEKVHPVTWTPGATETTLKLEVTAGHKAVIAVLNNPGDPAVADDGGFDWAETTTFLSDFKKSLAIAAAETGADPDLQFNFVSADGFTMIAQPDNESVQVVAGAQSPAVLLTAQRLASKVHVHVSQTPETDGFVPNDITFDITEVVKADGAAVTGVYGLMKPVMIREKNSVYHIADNKGKYGSYLNSGVIGDNKWVYASADGNWANLAAANTAYLTENIRHAGESALFNNTTGLIVGLRFNVTGFSTNPAGILQQLPNPDGTFYLVVKSKTQMLSSEVNPNKLDVATPYVGVYATEDVALAKVKELDANYDPALAGLYHIIPFDKGMAYYRVHLKSGKMDAIEQFSVYRNSYYRVTVDNVKNIGWGRPGDLQDEKDDTEVNDKRIGIDTTIEIEPWNVIDQNESLE